MLILAHIVLFFVVKGRLLERFRLLASECLVQNNHNFVELAKTTLERFQSEARGDLALKEQAIQDLVVPLKQSLDKYEKQVIDLERKREHAYGGMRQYLEDVAQTQGHLRRETSNLVQALRASHVRGKWGEMSLRRVVELAGMVEHCDFTVQESLNTALDSRLRPDMIVYLPGRRRVVVDAKVPLDSYLQAIEAQDEEQKERLLVEHARQLQRHIHLLGGKAYWQQVAGSPEFVVLYVPLESLFSSALRHSPQLLEDATHRKVILATPSTLIAMLKTINYGWNQETLAHNAEEVSALGKELYERIFKLAEHFTKLGVTLERAVQTYNETAGSFERRVFVQARRFRDLGVSAKESIPDTHWVEETPRRLQQDELVEAVENEKVSA